NAGTRRIVGKYGTNGLPGGGNIIFNPGVNTAGLPLLPHFYAKVDFDGKDTVGPTQKWTLPAVPYQMWPNYPPTTFINTDQTVAAQFRKPRQHPRLYTPPAGNAATPFHRIFTPAELELFYRFGDVGTSALQSDLAVLLSGTITDPFKSRSITTLSYDRSAP